MPQDIIPAGSFYPAPPPEDAGSRDQTKLLFFVILKWRRLILSLFLVFAVAAQVAVLFIKIEKEATAKILLKEDRTSLQISGLSSRTKSQYSLEALQSEIELLKSREVLLPVAKELLSKRQNVVPEEVPEELGWLDRLRLRLSHARANMKAFLRPYVSWVKALLRTYLLGGEEPAEQSEAQKLEAKIALLEGRLNGKTIALPIRDTNVIQVSYFAPNSAAAVETLDMILNSYMEQHAVAYGGSAKLLSFYEQEKGRVEADLRTAEEQVRKWQKANNVVAIENQISGLLDMRANQEKALQQTEAEGAMSRERDPLVTKLKSDLITAEIALQDLLQRYTDEDRHVQEKREQIALLGKELASAENALFASLASQQKTLRGQIRKTSAAVTALRDKKIEGDRLFRTVDLHKTAFLLYGKNLEEARIATRLDREQLSNVAVIEQPHAIRQADQNARTGLVLLAAMVGIVLGVAIAFGFEFFNNALRMQGDVEHYLGLPVLAAIPDLRDRHE